LNNYTTLQHLPIEQQSKVLELFSPVLVKAANGEPATVAEMEKLFADIESVTGDEDLALNFFVEWSYVPRNR